MQFDLTQTGELPKVSILYGYAGDDGDLAKAAVAAGAKGLVIAGTGAGHTQNARKVLKELLDATGVVVVRSARVGAGRVVRGGGVVRGGAVVVRGGAAVVRGGVAGWAAALTCTVLVSCCAGLPTSQASRNARQVWPGRPAP